MIVYRTIQSIELSRYTPYDVRGLYVLFLEYNFVKPHKSLRVLQIDGNQKWKQRTPVMAEGLTDHIWKFRNRSCSEYQFSDRDT
jgi:hypothetical protein